MVTKISFCWRSLVLAVALFSFGASARAACRDAEDRGVSYTICEFDAREAMMRLFLRDGKGKVYGSFSALESALADKGERLVFAMNAGMYDADREPVGLYIESGETLHRANTANGAGNFHMKPNGVFWIDGPHAGVTETSRFLASRQRPAFATQSGPLLLSSGRLNPHIHEDGQSKNIRNGVCVKDGRKAIFAISNEAVTFHAFSYVFRERYACSDALYFDGSISSLYARDINRNDRFRPMGPIVGAVERAEHR